MGAPKLSSVGAVYPERTPGRPRTPARRSERERGRPLAAECGMHTPGSTQTGLFPSLPDAASVRWTSAERGESRDCPLRLVCKRSFPEIRERGPSRRLDPAGGRRGCGGLGLVSNPDEARSRSGTAAAGPRDDLDRQVGASGEGKGGKWCPRERVSREGAARRSLHGAGDLLTVPAARSVWRVGRVSRRAVGESRHAGAADSTGLFLRLACHWGVRNVRGPVGARRESGTPSLGAGPWGTAARLSGPFAHTPLGFGAGT